MNVVPVRQKKPCPRPWLVSEYKKTWREGEKKISKTAERETIRREAIGRISTAQSLRSVECPAAVQEFKEKQTVELPCFENSRNMEMFFERVPTHGPLFFTSSLKCKADRTTCSADSFSAGPGALSPECSELTT